MGLTGSLNIALSGMRLTQTSLDLVARNIANAETPGYTKKSLRPIEPVSGSETTGVVVGEITRDVDAFLLQQLRVERAFGRTAEIGADFFARIDQLFGTPGGANALDTIVNEFGLALQDLVTSPDQVGSRETVLTRAQGLADHLNRMTRDIQTMRQEAEFAIGDATREANFAMQEIVRLNKEIQVAVANGSPLGDLQDQRDRFIDQLSGLLDIRVSENADGSVKIFSSGGDLLVGVQAATLTFDEHTGVNATSFYDVDDDKRQVGTLKIGTDGAQVDLFKHGNLNSGAIAALRDLRDGVLVEAQAQLDELAHALALALSTVDAQGTAVTPGPGTEAGFDLNIAGLQAGNPISVTFTDNPPGFEQTITFVRVDDPASLPLGDDVTPNPNDTVVGIDFSGGLAAAVAAMDAALGGNISVTSPAAETIRIVDDGAAGQSDIASVSARITATATSGQGLALPLFIDQGASLGSYSASLDGVPQKTGFAGRILVNPDVLNDPASLVVYSTSPPTDNGDPARPEALLDRFAETPFSFSAVSGISTVSQPFNGTISDFTSRVVNFQGQRAQAAERANEAQTIIVGQLESRLSSETAVDVDAEIADLINLQNAFAANARVISVVQELVEILLAL